MLNCIDAHYSVELYGLANSILASISTAMPRCNAIWLKSRLEQGNRTVYTRRRGVGNSREFDRELGVSIEADPPTHFCNAIMLDFNSTLNLPLIA